MRNFFISYTQEDQAWAEWIAWQLEAEQYTTVLQAWDFRPGENFVVRMRDALQEADRTIAVLSNAYLASPYATDEWTAAFLHDRYGRQRLLPVRVEACELPWLLATVIYIDLVGVDETTAKRRLRKGVTPSGRPRESKRDYPGGRSPQVEGRTEPRFPGERLKISNLPPRNPTFTGREQLLDKLHGIFSDGQATAVVAAHGLGGVGKTQLALEYAHRHREQYWLRWLVPAEDPLSIRSSLSELAARLGLPLEPEQERMVAAVRKYLDGTEGWLMVFDDAEEPADLLPLLPSSGQGHVIITTRNPNWEELADQLEVDVLSKEDAWAFLAQRTGNTDQPEVAQLAEELGYLPLALAQAAAYIHHTPELTVAGYLDLYRREHQRLLKAGKPLRYPGTVATTWLLNFERLIRTAPAAIQLLNLCAFLGAEVIPLSLLFQGEHRGWLSPELNEFLTDPLAQHAATSALYHYSLVSPAASGIQVHKLVQTVTRDRLDEQQEAAVWADRAVRLVWMAFPTPKRTFRNGGANVVGFGTRDDPQPRGSDLVNACSVLRRR